MNILKNNIIGDIVANDYRTAAVFQNFGIDFCCKGNRSIQDVCESKNIAPDTLMEELKQAIENNNSEEIDYNSLALDQLADHIEEKHHQYVRNTIPRIQTYLRKVVQVHGAKHPELAKIEGLFLGCAEALSHHMQKEEMILFPFIRKIAKAIAANEKMPLAPFGTVANPIAMMKEEHEAEGERFRQIAELSSDYTPPSDACNTYQVAFSLLQEFEKDLHLHIHLENNILFQKAMAVAG